MVVSEDTGVKWYLATTMVPGGTMVLMTPKMVTIGDRLTHAMKVRDVSARAVDRAVYGKPQASGWTTLVMRGKKIPTIPSIELAAKALAVRPAWLAFGEEPMDPKDENDTLLAAMFRGSPDQRRNFRTAVDYHRAEISDEAIRRAEAKMPSVGASVNELADLLLECQREVIQEAAEKRRKLRAKDPPAPKAIPSGEPIQAAAKRRVS